MKFETLSRLLTHLITEFRVYLVFLLLTWHFSNGECAHWYSDDSESKLILSVLMDYPLTSCTRLVMVKSIFLSVSMFNQNDRDRTIKMLKFWVRAIGWDELSVFLWELSAANIDCDHSSHAATLYCLMSLHVSRLLLCWLKIPFDVARGTITKRLIVVGRSVERYYGLS